MCLSTVFLSVGGQDTCVQKRVSRIQVAGTTIRLTDVIGNTTSVEGVISDIDLVDNIVRVHPTEE